MAEARQIMTLRFAGSPSVGPGSLRLSFPFPWQRCWIRITKDWEWWPMWNSPSLGESEPRPCCWLPRTVSAEAARTVPHCSPGRRKEAKERGDPCVLVDEPHSCWELGCFTLFCHLCGSFFLLVGSQCGRVPVFHFLAYNTASIWNFPGKVVGNQASLIPFVTV